MMSNTRVARVDRDLEPFVSMFPRPIWTTRSPRARNSPSCPPGTGAGSIKSHRYAGM